MVALYAGSYCKLIACAVVELWQHKISNIFRMVENCPHLRLHSFKSKRGCHPHKWMAYNLQAFCFDLVKVACL